MPEESISAWQRAAAFLARIIVRLWPDQAKTWGRAFQAELSEIPDPVASARWLVGGLMLLTREWWRSFVEGLARPIGVPPGGPQEIPGKNWTLSPRTPLWATVLLLLATATIVTHPEMRETFSNVWRKNTNPNLEPADWHSVKKLRKEAEINRDPQLLAWLSLLATDSADRIRLSEEAIEKDSSLTWLDYQQALLPSHDPRHRHYLGMDRLERLQRWDPDNAVPQQPIEKVVATAMGMKAGAKLQPVLKSMDCADEAELVGFQIAEWTAWRDQHFKKDREDWKIARRDGLTIQVIAFVVVLLSSMLVVSEAIVWSGRRTPLELRGRRFTFFCRMADVGPLLILTSSTVLFFIYHPYAQAYKDYLSHQWLPDIDSMIVVGG
jgi:hypothetical protein